MPTRPRVMLMGLVWVLATLAWLSAPVAAQGTPPASGTITIRGAGATLPAPLYEKWIQAYREQKPAAAISDDAVGSGEGQRRFLAEAVDFGASDAALTDEQIRRVRRGAQLIPVTAGIVVVAYNVPGLGGRLRLARDVYVDIFAGRIRT